MSPASARGRHTLRLRSDISRPVPLLGLLLAVGCAGDKGAPCALGLTLGTGAALTVVPSSPFTAVPSARLLGATPVRIDGEGDGPFTVVVAGAGRLLDETGSELDATSTLDALPATLFLEGVDPGEGTITVSAADCESASAAYSVVTARPLAGQSRAEAPGFGYENTVVDGAPVEIAVDPEHRPDLVGRTAAAYVVAHRSVEQWGADPTLTAASGTPPEVDLATAGSLTAVSVWSAADGDPDAFGASYDIVLDLDGDGAFSPGDAYDLGADGSGGLHVVSDLGAAGPHATDTTDVSGGDWLGERVYWPADIADLGPVPLVVISHGNGHEYTWYDYLGEHFASWGYVVMSHENETQPGIDTASQTTLTNTDWLLANLDQIGGGVLVDRVDANRIAWIGHSRGGEGVVRAYAKVHDGEYTPTGWSLASIRVITSIAPTVFYEVTQSNPYDVRYHILSGSSDGDVTGGPDFPEVQYWRLSSAGTGTVSTTYVYGASHEDFNCCGYDDGTGPDQLQRPDVQDIARGWLLAVVADGFETTPYTRAVLTHDPARLPATAFETLIASTWNDPDRLVIDDFQANADAGRASSGASVSMTVSAYAEGRLADTDGLLEWTGKEAMNGMTQAVAASDKAAGAVFEWEEPATVRYELPSEVRDWSAYGVFSLRACQGTRHPLTVAWEDAVDLGVTLIDGAGVSVTRALTPYGGALTPYLRGRGGEGKGWSNAYSTLRIPLTDFTALGTGLNLSDIRVVQLEFGGDALTPAGRLGIDDIEVTW